MSTPENLWIAEHAHKLDRALREHLAEMYRPAAAKVQVFQRALLAYRRRYQRLPVIVHVDAACSRGERDALVENLNRRGCRHIKCHGVIGGYSAAIPLGLLEQLVRDRRVRRISLDREVRALLDVAAPMVHAPEVWEAGYTGRGVTIAVVDTGIYPHEDFTKPRSRIVAFVDFVNGRQQPYDDNGHGTHVAGIAAGNGFRSGGRFRGIAPDASLAGVKVLNALGSGRLSTVIEGIEWCIRHREQYGIRVMTLSLGSPPQESYRNDPVAQAAGEAWKAGIVVCAAAGNDGPRPGTIASPGIHPRILTVGAVDKGNGGRGRPRVAPYSSRGPTIDGLHKPDVVAPGTDITAANAANSLIGPGSEPYITLSGTSMAAPVCSGIAALVLEWNPDLQPDEVKEHIVRAAHDLGFPVDAQGKGLVDAAGATQTGRPAHSLSTAAGWGRR